MAGCRSSASTPSASARRWASTPWPRSSRPQGHDVVLADLILHGTRSLRGVRDRPRRAELVGIGATSMAWPAALDAIAQVRPRRPEVPIVCGGIHPTLFDRYVLTTFPVQFVVRGEGEMALSRLCARPRRASSLSATCRISPGSIRRTPGAQRDRRQARAQRPGGLCRCRISDRLPPAAVQVSRPRVVARLRLRLLVLQHALPPKTWRGLAAEVVVDRLEHALGHLDRTHLRLRAHRRRRVLA